MERLPSLMMALMNRVTSTLSNFGSGTDSRRATKPLRGIPSFLSFGCRTCPGALDVHDASGDPDGARRPRNQLLRLGAVLRAALLASAHSTRVQRAAHDVVTHSRQILHAAPADEHDRVLLQVVPLARDVARHLDAVRQPHARDLAQRGVRLLRRGGVDARADPALLRA